MGEIFCLSANHSLSTFNVLNKEPWNSPKGRNSKQHGLDLFPRAFPGIVCPRIHFGKLASSKVHLRSVQSPPMPRPGCVPPHFRNSTSSHTKAGGIRGTPEARSLQKLSSRKECPLGGWGEKSPAWSKMGQAGAPSSHGELCRFTMFSTVETWQGVCGRLSTAESALLSWR